MCFIVLWLENVYHFLFAQNVWGTIRGNVAIVLSKHSFVTWHSDISYCVSLPATARHRNEQSIFNNKVSFCLHFNFCFMLKSTVWPANHISYSLYLHDLSTQQPWYIYFQIHTFRRREIFAVRSIFYNSLHRQKTQHRKFRNEGPTWSKA